MKVKGLKQIKIGWKKAQRKPSIPNFCKTKCRQYFLISFQTCIMYIDLIKEKRKQCSLLAYTANRREGSNLYRRSCYLKPTLDRNVAKMNPKIEDVDVSAVCAKRGKHEMFHVLRVSQTVCALSGQTYETVYRRNPSLWAKY